MHELRSSGSQNAFPVHSPETAEWRPGIDVADYFAAKALQGFVANTYMLEFIDRQHGDNLTAEQAKKVPLGIVAALCYSYADAMVAERDRRAAK